MAAARAGRKPIPRVEPVEMKRISLLAAGLLLLASAPAHADHIPGYEERPLTVREGRAAIAVVEGAGLRGWLRATVGGESVGLPPSPQGLREVCFEVAQREPLLFEKGCAPADAFVDDFFMTAQVAGTFETTVVDAFGQKVADSNLTVSAAWSRPFAPCTFPPDPQLGVAHPVLHRAQAGAPVTPYAETELLVACLADQITLQMSSAYFDARLDIEQIPGTPQGVLGLYAAEFWHLPEQCIPWPDDLCLPED